MELTFRPYSSWEKNELVAILLSNCPKYFREEDVEDFCIFLETLADENFLVVEWEGDVIGCGGHFTKKCLHGIAWAMFRSGDLGRRNLLPVAERFFDEIERRILAEGKYFDIQIETTQLMERLFNRFGFKTVSVDIDGFGTGLDKLVMVKSLSHRSIGRVR